MVAGNLLVAETIIAVGTGVRIMVWAAVGGSLVIFMAVAFMVFLMATERV